MISPRLSVLFAVFFLCAAPVLAVGNKTNSGTTGPFLWQDAYLRQAPSGVAAGYVTLKNPTGTADTLTGAKADWAKRIELHQIKADKDGVMSMSPVARIPLPAKGQIELKPGGYHLMIFDATADKNPDVKKNIVLIFEKAGPVTIPFAVRPIGQAAGTMATGHMHH